MAAITSDQEWNRGIAYLRDTDHAGFSGRVLLINRLERFVKDDDTGEDVTPDTQTLEAALDDLLLAEASDKSTRLAKLSQISTLLDPSNDLDADAIDDLTTVAQLRAALSQAVTELNQHRLVFRVVQVLVERELLK